MKVFGHSGVGKTTLIESLRAGYFSSLFRRSKRSLSASSSTSTSSSTASSSAFTAKSVIGSTRLSKSNGEPHILLRQFMFHFAFFGMLFTFFCVLVQFLLHLVKHPRRPHRLHLLPKPRLQGQRRAVLAQQRPKL